MSKNIDVLLIVTLSLAIAEMCMENLYSAIFIMIYTILLHASVRYYNLKDLKYRLLFELNLFFIALISTKVFLGVFKHIGL